MDILTTVEEQVEVNSTEVKVHNLTNLKNYPVVHRWITNRNLFSITANLPIKTNDVLFFGGKKFLIVDNYLNPKGRERSGTPVIRENVADLNLFFVTKDSTYYEFLTEQILS